MARRVITVTIDKDGRDCGKAFRLEEMPASQAERWAVRAFLGMAKSGIDIPDNIAEMGLAGIAAVGIKALAGIDINEADILMAEMMECAAIIPDPKKPKVFRALIEDDIEEISTRFTIRREILKLHIEHFTNAAG